jgi:hypothetical protein
MSLFTYNDPRASATLVHPQVDTAGELFLVGKRCQQAALNHGKVAPAPVFAAENSLQVGQHALESEFASSIR